LKESVEVENQAEADIEEVAQPEPIKPKRAGRGKKRALDFVAAWDMMLWSIESSISISGPSVVTGSTD
jgi:hypothetical protein